MQTFPILSRVDAAKRGSKRYFTGVPCRNGHIAQRYTKGGMCCACLNESSKQRARVVATGAFATITLNIPASAVFIAREWEKAIQAQAAAGTLFSVPAMPKPVEGYPVRQGAMSNAERNALWRQLHGDAIAAVMIAQADGTAQPVHTRSQEDAEEEGRPPNAGWT